MYFEFNEPYYALIKAKNIDDAVEEFQRTVSSAWTEDELDDLYRYSIQISFIKAFKTFVKCTKEYDNISLFKSIYEFMFSSTTETLLVDSNLL